MMKPGATDRLPGVRFHTLGIAAIAFLVHPQNPIDNISTEQVRRIFKGEIYDRFELGTGTLKEKRFV